MIPVNRTSLTTHNAYTSLIPIQPMRNILLSSFLILVAATALHAQPGTRKAITEQPPSYSSQELQNLIHYPPAARDSNVQGSVTVRAVVDPTGAVLRTDVVQSSHPLLNDSAVAAVRGVHYTPARWNNIPVASIVQIDISFTMSPVPPAGEPTKPRSGRTR